MQDDEAMENGIKIARATNQPFYVLHTDGVMRDETGRFPDKIDHRTIRLNEAFARWQAADPATRGEWYPGSVK